MININYITKIFIIGIKLYVRHFGFKYVKCAPVSGEANKTRNPAQNSSFQTIQ